MTMTIKSFALFVLATGAVSVQGLRVGVAPRHTTRARSVHTAPGSIAPMMSLNRRSFLAAPGSIAAAAAVLSVGAGQANAATTSPKVVVVGGAGWVGSYVDQELLSQGATVTSVSRSSPADQAARVKANTGAKDSNALTFVQADAATDDLAKIFKGCDAVINCVGVAPGSPDQLDGNGAVNVRIADAAKAAGVPRFVYIGVASNMGVTNSVGRIALGDYFKGKAIAEAATAADYSATSSLIIKPAAVKGKPKGESRPPSPPGAAPNTPRSLAKVAVAGAFGLQSGVVDGALAIDRAASKADLSSVAAVVNPNGTPTPARQIVKDQNRAKSIGASGFYAKEANP